MATFIQTVLYILILFLIALSVGLGIYIWQIKKSLKYLIPENASIMLNLNPRFTNGKAFGFYIPSKSMEGKEGRKLITMYSIDNNPEDERREEYLVSEDTEIDDIPAGKLSRERNLKITYSSDPSYMQSLFPENSRIGKGFVYASILSNIDKTLAKMVKEGLIRSRYQVVDTGLMLISKHWINQRMSFEREMKKRAGELIGKDDKKE